MYHLCKHMPLMLCVILQGSQDNTFPFLSLCIFPLGPASELCCLSVDDRPGFYFRCIKIRSILLGIADAITVPDSKREKALDIHPLETFQKFILWGANTLSMRSDYFQIQKPLKENLYSRLYTKSLPWIHIPFLEQIFWQKVEVMSSSASWNYHVCSFLSSPTPSLTNT